MHKRTIFKKNNNGDIMIYLIIFICKIVENTLTTLRIILISSGKKKIGAIIQGIVALIWIFSTSLVIINIDKDFFKIVSFVLGSIIGSYLGSITEELIALGTIMMIIKSNKELNNILTKYKFVKYNNYFVITCKRKDKNNIIKDIRNIDKDCKIINLRIKKIR